MPRRWPIALGLVVLVVPLLGTGAATAATAAAPPDPTYTLTSEFTGTPPRDQIASWTGIKGRDRFTEAEVHDLATKRSAVVIAKFHAGWDRADQRTDAALVRGANSATRTYFYRSAKFSFKEWRTPEVIPDELVRCRLTPPTESDPDNPDCIGDWLLHDANDHPLPLDTAGNTFYLDLANAELRAWMVSDIEAELVGNQTAWSGVALDSVRRLGTYFEGVLGGPDGGKERVKDWNDGLNTLVADVVAKVGKPNVVANGLGARDWDLTRNEDIVGRTGTGLNEDFCVQPTGEPGGLKELATAAELVDEYALAKRLATTGTAVIEQSSVKPEEVTQLGLGTKRQALRLCFAAFLGARADGTTRFGGANNYEVTDEIGFGGGAYIPWARYRLGTCLDGPWGTDGLFRRSCQRAQVLVNTTPYDLSVSVPPRYPYYVDLNGAVEPTSSTLTVPAKSALLMVRGEYVQES